MTDLIKMTSLRKTYDGKSFVLKDVNFSLQQGEIAIVSGASGCGKSTFLNIVGLLDSFTDGSYEFMGKSVRNKKLNSYYKQRATDIGFVFQAYCLIESISVKDNILMPYLYNNAAVDSKIIAEANQMMEELNISSLADKKAALLSGGEKQRVAICRAMIKKPKLIIADEPTGNLDEGNTALVVNAFNKIVANGTSVIVVTHNMRLNFENSKRFLLEEGMLKLP